MWILFQRVQLCGPGGGSDITQGVRAKETDMPQCGGGEAGLAGGGSDEECAAPQPGATGGPQCSEGRAPFQDHGHSQ